MSSFEEGERYLAAVRNREIGDEEKENERVAWLEARRLCDDDYLTSTG